MILLKWSRKGWKENINEYDPKDSFDVMNTIKSTLVQGKDLNALFIPMSARTTLSITNDILGYVKKPLWQRVVVKCVETVL